MKIIQRYFLYRPGSAIVKWSYYTYHRTYNRREQLRFETRGCYSFLFNFNSIQLNAHWKIYVDKNWNVWFWNHDEAGVCPWIQNNVYIVRGKKSEMIKMFYQNVNSILAKKRDKLRFVTNQRTYDFLIFTETYLNSSVNDDQIISSNYAVIRTDRRKGINDRKAKGGGVLTAVDRDISCERIACDDSIEIAAIKATIENETVFIIVSYIRNDREDLIYNRKFCHESKLERHLNVYRQIKRMLGPNDSMFIFGDFNMSSIKYARYQNCMIPTNLQRVTDYYRKFYESMNEMGLLQINTIANRNDRYLDLIFTNKSAGITIK